MHYAMSRRWYFGPFAALKVLCNSMSHDEGFRLHENLRLDGKLEYRSRGSKFFDAGN